MALSMIPVERIDDAWIEIDADSPGTDHAAYDQLNAFKEYYIGTWLENESVYPRSLWNHYG